MVVSEHVTDEAVEKAAQALHDNRAMRSHALHEVGEPLGNTVYDNERRADARAALEAAAPLIAAAAWDEGYAMSERELDHAYGGHPISPDGPSDLCHECGTGNPYRADGIERGES